jgi:subtilisin family serine protease
VRAAGAVVGALAAVSLGLAPNASAADAQSMQWYLGPMQVEQMWKVTKGEGVKIAVLDSGVNPNTPSLKGQVLADELPKSVAYGATEDFRGHGTTIAELIVGTGADGGIKGLAPGAKVVPYRVQLFGEHLGEEADKETPFEVALRAAADSEAKIINMSIGGMTDDESEAAVKYAASKGKLLVAAVGNEGVPDAPAIYPYVLGVGAADSNYKVSKFSKESSRGYTDLVAPGQGLPAWCDETFRSYCQAHSTRLGGGSADLVRPPRLDRQPGHPSPARHRRPRLAQGRAEQVRGLRVHPSPSRPGGPVLRPRTAGRRPAGEDQRR